MPENILSRVAAYVVVVLGLCSTAGAVTPIQTENAQPGTTAWQLSNPATNREIEGFASLTSVNQGAQISLFVNTADPSYNIDIYRIGWYGGVGSRQVLGPVTLTGTKQPMPPIDYGTGLIECQWINPYVITVPSSWLSGIYLAKLTGSGNGKQSYIIFTVREDSRPSAYLFQSSVTTYQAYNNWPGSNFAGKSLYDFNSFNGAAYKVSFNRPYALGQNPMSSSGMGAGDFVTNPQPSFATTPGGWEINMVRFLEREGYDVTYCTNLDVHENATLLLSHQAFLSVGHDEYWSWEMRANVESARDHGVGLGFFSSNVSYWIVRFEPSPANGAADRTMVGFKSNYTIDPYYYDSDPTNNKYITYLWRANFGQKPSEQAMIGVEYITNPVDTDLIITAAPSHWALQGTGLIGGQHLPGLLGYEVDGMLDSNSPSTISVIAQTPLSNGGPHPYSEMTAYVAPSGATVFATGSMQWSWGLDDFNAPALRTSRLNPAAQQITRNVLSRLTKITTGGTAQYIATDTTTQGNWKGTYGQNGYIIANDSTNPPAYSSLNFNRASLYTWAGSTSDSRALLKGGSVSDRIASTFYSNNGFTIDLNLTDGLTHQVAFYALDWDNAQRTETFSLIDGESGAVRDTRTISNFVNGQYLIWRLSGHILISVKASSGPNAVVSGVFFPGTPGADLTIRKTHSGNFALGDIGDTYSITVTNSGGSVTAGSISVTDTLPAGLIPTGIVGPGWTCTQPAGPCSRLDPLNGGGSYPPIAITVNVASNAPASVTNTAAVAGGGDIDSSNNTAADLTTIVTSSFVAPSFLTGYALNGPSLRNNVTGWLGVMVGVGAGSLIVDSLGRACIAGNSGTHIVKLVNAGTGADVPGGAVAVSLSGCVPGQFVYSYLTSAITLQKNAGYFLVSQEFNGGDQWYDIGAVSATSDAGVNGGIYSLDGLNWIPAPQLATNTSYIPPNFRYIKQSLGPVSVTVQTNISGLSFSVDGTSYSTSQVFSWTSGSAHTIATTSSQTGTAGQRYNWNNWSDGGALLHAVSGTNTATFTASFTTQYPLTSGVSPAGSGSVTANPPSATAYYDAGSAVQVTAAPSSGFAFVNWSGDSSGSANPQTITMTAPRNVIANLQAIGPSGSGFVTAYNLNAPPLRNNFNGWVGMKLTIGANPLSVSSLGRICVAGNSGVHVVKFVNGSTGTDVPGGSRSLSMSGCATGQFFYATLASPITLLANTVYYLVTQELLGGDLWYDHGAVTSTKDAAVNSSVYFDGVNWIPVDGPNTSYVPPNFQYSVQAPPPPSSSAPLITGYNLNTAPLRNNFSGWVGTKFTVGAGPITVTSLGRIIVAGNGATHSVKLVRASDRTDVPGATVSVLSAGAAAGQFAYTPLATSITLPANTTYYLVSQEAFGGDQWYDHGTVASTTDVTINSSIYFDGANWIPVDAANTSYVPSNLLYSVTSSAPPDLTITKTHSGGFAQGDTGNIYTITITNSGLTATSGVVSVIDNVPAGLTATAISGAGWSCAQPAGPCTRSDALSGGGTYPAITVTVNVAANAPASVTNTATVSGGGESNSGNDTASDPTTIAPLIAVSVQTNLPGLSFSVDGATYTSAQVFNWKPGSSHTIATTSVQAGGTGIQNIWSSWNDTGTISHTVSPSSATTYTANFTTQYLLTSSVSSGGGSIAANPVSASGYYNSGAAVQLTPAPNSGYVFLNWSGDLTGVTSPQTVTMLAPRTVTANFQALVPGINAYALSGPPPRNDFSGWVGMKLTVGSNSLFVGTLGRICIAGNSGTHAIKFVNASTGIDVPGASVSLNMAGCTAGQFSFAALANPIVLQAATPYYLVSQETQGGDQWYDCGTVSAAPSMVVNSAIYFYGGTWFPVGATDNSYTPPNFQYSMGPSAPGLITGYTQNNTQLRNDFSGWLGMKFTSGTSGLTVNSLGRLFVSGNNSTHTVKLVRASDGTDVPGGSVAVSMIGGTPGVFSYAPLPTSITLSPNTAYYLVSQEAAGGDQWYNSGTVSTSSSATVNNAVYFLNGAWVPVGGANQSYVPPNLK